MILSSHKIVGLTLAERRNHYKRTGYINYYGLSLKVLFEPQEFQEWKRLSWESEEPSGTSVSMFFRYNRQSDWLGPFSESIDLTEYESEGTNQFQYRVILESENPEETPVLQSVTVEWE